jgi:septation ring formation regulator EzrA
MEKEVIEDPEFDELKSHHHRHQQPLERIERKIDNVIRRLKRMAANEADFDAALTEFLTSLDAGLTAIQAKIDSLGVTVDFTDELASLDSAKTKLSDFVAANSDPVPPPA